MLTIQSTTLKQCIDATPNVSSFIFTQIQTAPPISTKVLFLFSTSVRLAIFTFTLYLVAFLSFVIMTPAGAVSVMHFAARMISRSPLLVNTPSLELCILLTVCLYSFHTYIHLHISPYTFFAYIWRAQNIFLSLMMPLIGESLDLTAV